MLVKDEFWMLRNAWEIAHKIYTDIANWINTQWSEVDFSALSNVSKQ